MGSSCCKLFRKREFIVNLREDPLQFPVQVAPDYEQNIGLVDDFVDLRQDVFPVLCTQPSDLNVAHYCIDTSLSQRQTMSRNFTHWLDLPLT